MQGDLERQEKQLQVLKQSLKQDPTNLESAIATGRRLALLRVADMSTTPTVARRSRPVPALRLSHELTGSCFRAAEKAPAWHILTIP
jgi:hypothetical protein